MNIRKLFGTHLVLAIVIMLVSACGATTPTPTEEAISSIPTNDDAWQSVDCASIDVAPSVAAIADCGYVTVPANRATGSDQTIQLAVAHVHSPSAAPGTPIFLGTGGPGGYGFGYIQAGYDANWPQSHATVLADHDWVFFTQRGTPGAKPELMCLPFDFLSLDIAKNGWSEDQVAAETTARIQACYDELVQQGVNFADFNSVENAEDVNAIREALGYDKIIYYGESYGTQLGQYLMRQHPEILEAVVLDGVVPVEFTTFAQTTNTTDGFKRALDACKADPECDSIYPNLENVLSEAYDALNANPASVQKKFGDENVTLYVTGLNLMDALFGNIYGGAADVPRYIYGANEGDPAVLAALAPSYNPLNRRASMMNFAINCSDDPSTSADEFEEEGVLPMYTAYTLDFARRYMLASCPVMNVPHLSDSLDMPVTADISTLVLNGALDPATSAANGDLVASHLPNAQEVTFPNGGHIQLRRPCAQVIIAAFLQDPSAELDTSCVPAKQTFRLPIAATWTSADGTASITVTLPGNYLQGNPEQPQWQGGSHVIILRIYPAGTTIEDALQDALAPLNVQVDAAEFGNGPTIAGLPSKTFQGSVPSGYLVDLFGIANENGAYVIQAVETDPTQVEGWRTFSLPKILGSAVIGPTTGQESAPSSNSELAMLTGQTWMWTEFTDPAQQFNVEHPENYTLRFLEDGTLQFEAGCNSSWGEYTVDGSSIQINETFAMSLVACPPESRSDDFIKYLSSAAIYFFQDGNLYIDMVADGGTMTFSPAAN